MPAADSPATVSGISMGILKDFFTRFDFAGEIIALVVTLCVGLLINPKLRRLLGLPTKYSENEQEKGEEKE